jgi:hypothetical protein
VLRHSSTTPHTTQDIFDSWGYPRLDGLRNLLEAPITAWSTTEGRNAPSAEERHKGVGDNLMREGGSYSTLSLTIQADGS